MKYCVYCQKPLNSNSSKEHIIPNAIGGLLESCDICCKVCNEELGEKEDIEFTKIFIPITENFNIKKSRKTANSEYKAIVVDENGKEYNAKMKGNKIWTVYNENGEYYNNKLDLNKLKPISYEFSFDNKNFKNGLKKIAFNFAVHNEIPIEKLEQVFDMSKKRLILDSSTNVIPFIPLNYFDEYLELNSNVDLKHSLIIFSVDNFLVVYIDLFNTFQYYVVLSDRWTGKDVYISYCQLLEKHDLDEEKLREIVSIRDIKDADIVGNMYGIKKTMDFEQMEKDAFNVLRKREYEVDYLKWIYDKMCIADFSRDISVGNREEILNKFNSFRFYVVDEVEYELEDGNVVCEDEGINKNRFRIYNISKEEVEIYFLAVLKRIQSEGIDKAFDSYGHKKFNKLMKELFNKRVTYFSE